MARIVVTGALAVDVTGISVNKIVPGDSNIGRIGWTDGGVGRNIAENLYRLGADVLMVAPVGTDGFASVLKDNLSRLALPYRLIEKKDMATNCYLAVHDQDGSLVSGVNDFAAIEALVPDDFTALIDAYENAEVIVLDCNLPASVLEWFCQNYAHKRIFVDGVSRIKVRRILKLLDKIELLKVNRGEMESLLGRIVPDIPSGLSALMTFGLDKAVVTDGARSIHYNQDRNIFPILPLKPSHPISSIGAGDALMAGVTYGLSLGLDMTRSITYGLILAKATMEVNSAVNPELNRSILE